MPHSPQRAVGSRIYEDGWRAINELIRADGSWSGRERNVCYRNLGGGRFEDVSYVSGLDFADDGRAWVALDLDGDGDLDLVLKQRTGPQLRVMRNDLSSGRAGLMVELEGVKANRDAVGASATLITDRRRIRRDVRSGSGFLSQSSRRLHFGIPSGESATALEIVWPGGGRQRVEAPLTGLIRVREGHPAVPYVLSPVKTVEAPSQGVETERPWLAEPVPAPQFTLPGLSGGMHSLEHYRGNKVLMNLWATWCPPCRVELDELREGTAQLTAAGVQVLAVSVDKEEDRAKVAAISLPFPTLLANDRTVGVYSILYRHLFDRRRDLGLPMSFLIDEKGDVVKVYQGAVTVNEILRDASGRDRPALPFSGRRIGELPGRNFNELATAMAERSFAPEARALFELAIGKGQGGYELLNNFAGLMAAAGDGRRAEELLRAAILESGNQAAPHANLGLLLLEQGRLVEGAAALTRAIQLDPGDSSIRRSLSSAHNDLGIGLMEQGKAAEAAAEFRKAILADPTDTAGSINLALYHVQANERAQAIEILRRLLMEYPDLQPARDLLRQLQ